MADRHDGVGDAGSDVGAHDDEDGIPNGDDCRHKHNKQSKQWRNNMRREAGNSLLAATIVTTMLVEVDEL